MGMLWEGDDGKSCPLENIFVCPITGRKNSKFLSFQKARYISCFRHFGALHGMRAEVNLIPKTE